MKTPFDTVLRMRRREIDRTRIAIHMETTRLTRSMAEPMDMGA
mgnify:FL=1